MSAARVRARDRGVMFLGLFVTIVSMGGAFAMGDFTIPPPPGEDGDGDWVISSRTILMDGNAAEGNSESEGVTLDEEKVIEVRFVLTWEDEPDADARHNNEPDTFRLEAESAFGNDSQESSSGDIELSFSTTEEEPWNMNGVTWNLTITAVSCGDQEPLIPDPIIGLRTIADGGNDYSLEVEIRFLAKEITQAEE